MLRLSALYRFPLKSGKGQSLRQASLDKLGLAGDRRWMLVDEASGRFLTQRAVPSMSQLSALWNPAGGLTLAAPGHSSIEVDLPADDAQLRGVTIWRDTLRVPDAGAAAAAWVSEFIGKPTRLVQVPEDRARLTEAGYGRDDDKVAFADGYPTAYLHGSGRSNRYPPSRTCAAFAGHAIGHAVAGGLREQAEFFQSAVEVRRTEIHTDQDDRWE